ncbi:MAG: amidohydrolase [Xanthomonadales bacterium]|nr:putative hydrolase YxeP [Xanthomonadales bacterium]MCC6592023.1 amidohydrolase [Xanthomonadales bacterium]MCE7931401.1 amidohydrolase [Xanthomonadales bacterium PRO6]
MRRLPLLTALFCIAPPLAAAAPPELLDQVRAWRRDFHQYPELGNRETRTAGIVAAHLKRLGLEVREGVAHTGVVGYLRGAAERPLIAVRADMDALPVREELDLPFASKVQAEFRGERVGVMHACGHDAHTAVLMGVAAALAGRRGSLPGSILLVFQPAEEGPPAGEQGGAPLMLEQGLFAPPRKPDMVLGLHVFSTLHVGSIGVRAGPFMAESDSFRILVRGVQTHGSRPWGGVDPVHAAARIVDGLQGIVSRRLDLTAAPAVVSVGAIKGGIRYNIIPAEVELIGTVRSFDTPTRDFIWSEIRRIAEHTAQAHHASTEISFEQHTRVTRNDPVLTERLRPALARATGVERVVEMPMSTVAEDFAYLADEVPGLYFFVGSTGKDIDPLAAPSNHSPRYLMDEGALAVGLNAMLAAVDAALEVRSE